MNIYVRVFHSDIDIIFKNESISVKTEKFIRDVKSNMPFNYPLHKTWK